MGAVRVISLSVMRMCVPHSPTFAFLVTFTAAISHSVAGLGSSDPFYVKLVLSGYGIASERSTFTLEVLPEWAPLGAARFRELVDAKFYDDQRFFRVLDGDYNIWIAQFGLHGDPKVSAEWNDKNIPDDPTLPTNSNKRGTLAFAMAGP